MQDLTKYFHALYLGALIDEVSGSALASVTQYETVFSLCDDIGDMISFYWACETARETFDLSAVTAQTLITPNACEMAMQARSLYQNFADPLDMILERKFSRQEILQWPEVVSLMANVLDWLNLEVNQKLRDAGHSIKSLQGTRQSLGGRHWGIDRGSIWVGDLSNVYALANTTLSNKPVSDHGGISIVYTDRGYLLFESDKRISLL